MNNVVRTPYSANSHIGLDAFEANTALKPKIFATRKNGNIQLTIELYIDATPTIDDAALPQEEQNQIAENFMNVTLGTDFYSDGMTVSFDKGADDKTKLSLSANVVKKPPNQSGN